MSDEINYERLFNPRKARCGACGTEWLVDSAMRRYRFYQYKRRPDKDHDDFYCGCQEKTDDIPF